MFCFFPPCFSGTQKTCNFQTLLWCSRTIVCFYNMIFDFFEGDGGEGRSACAFSRSQRKSTLSPRRPRSASCNPINLDLSFLPLQLLVQAPVAPFSFLTHFYSPPFAAAACSRNHFGEYSHGTASNRAASAASASVMPPAACVVTRTVTTFQPAMDTSGWWPSASAMGATADIQAAAAEKVRALNARSKHLPSSVRRHAGSDLRWVASSAGVRSGVSLGCGWVGFDESRALEKKGQPPSTLSLPYTHRKTHREHAPTHRARSSSAPGPAKSGGASVGDAITAQRRADGAGRGSDGAMTGEAKRGEGDARGRRDAAAARRRTAKEDIEFRV